MVEQAPKINFGRGRLVYDKARRTIVARDAAREDLLGRLEAPLRHILEHWNEFGPEHGFEEVISRARHTFDAYIAESCLMEAGELRGERFTVGRQPCSNFLRGDADVAALGPGNRRNLHQCPKCEGNRAWCDNCHTDHHDGGWETCQPGAYAEPDGA